jgi:transglutaminase-like putative cysteine protease
MRSLLWALLIISLLPATLSFAQSNKPRVEKEPAWVTVHTPDYNDTKLDQEAEGGYVDLILDKQVSVGTLSTYYKRAYRIISESGVQNASEVSVGFDPSYSQLIFHSINIIRSGEKINKLQLSKIKTIQQESELNRYLYNGALSSVLFLEDVRKGDIVEYSYTVKGSNPVFKGKYTDMLTTSFGVPMYYLYYRIILPKGRDITIKNSLTDIKYTKAETAKETTYDWKQEKIPALHLQDRIPGWYDPYAMVMVSEYKDWKEVNDWALQLFPFSNKLSPALQKKVEEIKKADTSVEKRILAALRFVQDDVRYLGIEMGEGSHKPHHPDKVFTQRFGDCKDKSYLLCTMLQALGVEAKPVLISSTYRKTINDWLPAPTVFDHTTVCVRYEGRAYWFDPTISYQRGKLKDISYPDYQYGLIIEDSTRALTAIAPQNNKGLIDIKEEFSIPDMFGAARLVVRTTYSGAFADDIRDDFNSSSMFEMRKTFQTFYTGYFEKINIDSLTYTDDDQTGKFTTWEYYTIKDFWEKEGSQKKCWFSPFVISGVLKKPKDANRTMPFYITHPAKYHEEVIVNLPEDWNFSDMMEEMKCPAFTMRAHAAYAGRKLKLKYEFESLKDHVLPTEATSFFKEYKTFEENVSYMLSKGDGEEVIKEAPKKKEKEGVNTGFIIIAVLLISGGILWWTQRR